MASRRTKWHAPAVRRQLVRRPRLVDRLLVDAQRLPRLVLVCAPAGFGKTTVVTQWLDDWAGEDGDQPRRVAWLSLDAADDDGRRLVTGIVAALAEVVPGVGAQASQLLRADGPVAPEAVLAGLLADLDVAEGAVVLVLDDYHLVRSAQAHAAVAFLLQNLPAQVSLVLTTRADPPLSLARLRARGELVELRAQDLRFTVAEATGFLNEVMGLTLQARQLEALQGRTEGWAVGLQLAALSLRGRDDPDALLERFTGSHRFVLDYLVEEVLDTCDDTDRAFLLDTCVLDRLTGPLCDALTGRDDGQQRLAALERANLFVLPLDDTRTWYRYHQLFADALRARLAAADPQRFAKLHRAAAGWWAGQGRPETAIPHAVSGQDVDHAATLVELALPEASRRRQDRTMRHWLALLPQEQVRARPLLQVATAWCRLGDGDVDDAQARLRAAEQLLGSTSGQAGDGDEELRRLPLTIAMYRAAIAQARQDPPETARQARRILDLAEPQDHLPRGAALGFLGMAAWADGDLPAAIETFTECTLSLRAAGNLTDELGCTVPLGLMWWARGRPDEAGRLHERALDQARRHPAMALPVTGDLHVGLAASLLERDDLAAAAEHLAIARELGETGSLPENRHRWYLASARLCQAQGDLDGAAVLLEQAQARYLPGFFPQVRPIPALRARLDIARGRVELARDWARLVDVQSLEVTYRSECDLLTFARLLLAEGEVARARRLLAGLLAAAERAGRAGSVVEIMALEALAAFGAGDAPAAVGRLRRALDVAEPAGYARLFLDEGVVMTELLGLAGRSAGGGDQRAGPPPDHGLSDRELEVLRLLATELTGPQIAGRLFVSVNTLRTHTRHIFTKLEVTTRAGAVRRGRELRLL